jgi:tetrahydromethanopterin S-methyltransferase subunit B
MASKFDISIDQIAITMSTNIPGQSDLELTSDMFATEAPSNFKTEKYPFISDTVLLEETVLQTKLYPELLRIFFMRDEFYTFNRDNYKTVVKLEGTETEKQAKQAEMVTKNVNIMIRCLFDTYPTLNNYTNSLDGTFETSWSMKTHKFSYLVIGSKVYTVARIVWINDIFEHPVYDTFVNNYNKFERWREGDIKNITNTNAKQLANMEKTLKDFKGNAKDMGALTDDISKIESYAANKNNWTGRGASDVVKRNAMVILGKYLKRIATKLKDIAGGAGPTDPDLKKIEKAYKKEKKEIDQFKGIIEKILEKYIQILENDYTPLTPLKRATKSSKPSISTEIKKVMDLISDMAGSEEEGENDILPALIAKVTTDTSQYNMKTQKENTEKEINEIIQLLSGAIRKPDLVNGYIKKYKDALPSRGRLTKDDKVSLLVRIKDPIITRIKSINEQIEQIEEILSKVEELFKKPKTTTLVLEPELDVVKDELSKKEIDAKIATVLITDPDFLSELNRTYKIIIDSNILPLSLAVKTLIKDITEKNQKIVKLSEVIKYLESTDMFENFKKIEYDNPSYNTLIEAVFGDKRKISRMINHAINKPPDELTKAHLDALAETIRSQTKSTKDSNKKDYLTGISYDNTAIDKPRYGIYLFVDFIDDKADATNNTLDLCAFRDELLYNDLNIMTSNKVQKTIHDPLIHLVKASPATGGTRRKRVNISRRTKKNRR